MARASVVLPQPLSPTRPTTSPGPIVEIDAVEHLGHARRRWRSRRGARARRAAQPSRAVTAAPHPRIEDVAQAVAQQVEAHHGEEDGEARRQRRTTTHRAGTRATRRSCVPIPASAAAAPRPRKPSAAAVRIVKPMPIEVRTMIGEMTLGSTCSRMRRQRRGAERGRASMKISFLSDARLGVDEAGEPRPVGDGQREDDVRAARGQRLRDGDGEHDLRHGEEDVGHAHQQIARPASGGSRRRGRSARRSASEAPTAIDADQDRDARAEQEAAVDVGAHPVGADQCAAAGRLQALRPGACSNTSSGCVASSGARSAASTSSSDQQRPTSAERSRASARRTKSAPPHDVRSRGSTRVWAMSTSRLTTMKIDPAQTVKPITAL